jgi:hypothetical protein
MSEKGPACLYVSLRPNLVPRSTVVVMAKDGGAGEYKGAGTITQLPSGRWRLRVTFNGR